MIILDTFEPYSNGGSSQDGYGRVRVGVDGSTLCVVVS